MSGDDLHFVVAGQTPRHACRVRGDACVLRGIVETWYEHSGASHSRIAARLSRNHSHVVAMPYSDLSAEVFDLAHVERFAERAIRLGRVLRTGYCAG